MKILHTFKKEITISLKDPQRTKALRILSLHYLGDEECNVMKDGRLVAKYPGKETQELKETHYACCRSYIVEVDINLMEDGSLRLAK